MYNTEPIINVKLPVLKNYYGISKLNLILKIAFRSGNEQRSEIFA